ncbi:MAG: hypothetical protein ABF285_03220 [Pacificibacter sp.]|jgi:hypothetical protein|uniref:hypothetical protein n=1 Tax=Pacificibacter sp. TaxID=1917866 RepID=UPI00321A15CB
MKPVKFDQTTQTSFFDSVAFDWIVFASAITCLGIALMAALSTGLSITEGALTLSQLVQAVMS